MGHNFHLTSHMGETEFMAEDDTFLQGNWPESLVCIFTELSVFGWYLTLEISDTWPQSKDTVRNESMKCSRRVCSKDLNTSPVSSWFTVQDLWTNRNTVKWAHWQELYSWNLCRTAESSGSVLAVLFFYSRLCTHFICPILNSSCCAMTHVAWRYFTNTPPWAEHACGSELPGARFPVFSVQSQLWIWNETSKLMRRLSDE